MKLHNKTVTAHFPFAGNRWKTIWGLLNPFTDGIMLTFVNATVTIECDQIDEASTTALQPDTSQKETP